MPDHSAGCSVDRRESIGATGYDGEFFQAVGRAYAGKNYRLEESGKTQPLVVGLVSPEKLEVLYGGRRDFRLILLPTGALRISAITWRRLRLTVEFSGELADVTVEVRRKERDPTSRVDVASTIEGTRARLTVSDEAEEGDPVLVVLIDRHGSVIDARATRIGDRV